jgi:hypothetical protein
MWGPRRFTTLQASRPVTGIVLPVERERESNVGITDGNVLLWHDVQTGGIDSEVR